MVHLAPYVGVPRALAGLRVAAAAFRELGVDPQAPRTARPMGDPEPEGGR